jgi:hypothetical protein
MRDDFISEEDLDTFEGWLKYQGFDAATMPPDQLASWHDLYNEVKAESVSTPKVGLMKLRAGEHRYAVALRDGADLWLTLWVRRSPKGDVYVLTPRGDKGWNPHTSYHRNGNFHMKSYNNKFFVQKRQPLTGSFRGTEHLGLNAGHAKRVGAICDPKDFSGVIEVAPGILGPKHGSVAVDLVEPGCEPLDVTTSQYRKEVARQEFRDAIPHVVIRVLADISR